MFLILLKVIQQCLTECPQGYDSDERPETPMIGLLFNNIWRFPLFWPYFPQSSRIYFYRKQIRPTYLILIFHAIVNSLFWPK